MSLKIPAPYIFSSGICSHSWTAVSMSSYNCGINDFPNVASVVQMHDNLMGQGQVCVVDGPVSPSEMTDCNISCVQFALCGLNCHAELWHLLIDLQVLFLQISSCSCCSMLHCVLALNVVPWGCSSTWMTPSACQNRDTITFRALLAHVKFFVCLVTSPDFCCNGISKLVPCWHKWIDVRRVCVEK